MNYKYIKDVCSTYVNNVKMMNELKAKKFTKDGVHEWDEMERLAYSSYYNMNTEIEKTINRWIDRVSKAPIYLRSRFNKSFLQDLDFITKSGEIDVEALVDFVKRNG